MRLPAVLFVLALTVAGCVAPGSTLDPSSTDIAFDDLASSAAQTILSEDGTVTLIFEGSSPVGVGALLARYNAPTDPLGTFEVDDRVGYADVSIAYTSPLEALAVVLLDDEGRTLCAHHPTYDGGCTAPVPPGDARTWSLSLQYILATEIPDTPITVTVVLHPPSDIPWGDPLAGIDPTISFRVSDTGVDGSEDNIGILADGTIFTQKGLATMKSVDDGMTWKDVAPPLNRQESLDPMLFVDPWRDLVLVDHLYVACSQLSWSTDAGASWLQNPAACGLPANDHQKIASGPNPLPVPLPAIYYTYSSFAQGVWASRSLDGGLTWTSVPVVGLGDGREYSNTGPIHADEMGNVYIPLYMCDGDGYMGVGVSNDHGATWRFVEAASEPGPCYDVDPGLWTDTDGTVYLAYHRPTGVKYVHSQDHGSTWSEPVTVSPPMLLSFVHVDAVAGDPGRLAIVYRATSDSARGPDLADGWAAWHLYVSFVENATSDSPTIRTGIVNDPEDPVQRGPICTMGIACFGGSRNLLDFIDIAVGPDGRVYPTYTDGCDTACPTPADSRARLGHVGVQVEGPRLFANKAPWAS